MEDCEVFWRAKFIKLSPDNDTDYKLNLVINPIKIIYEASFINEIINFFSTNYNTQLKQ